MRVRNVHTAPIEGIKPGEEGDLPRNFGVGILVKGGLLEELARVDVPTPLPSEPPTSEPEPVDLREIHVKNTRTLIRDTNDPDLLSQWLKAETRKTVRAWLSARLEALSDGRNGS